MMGPTYQSTPVSHPFKQEGQAHDNAGTLSDGDLWRLSAPRRTCRGCGDYPGGPRDSLWRVDASLLDSRRLRAGLRRPAQADTHLGREFGHLQGQAGSYRAAGVALQPPGLVAGVRHHRGPGNKVLLPRLALRLRRHDFGHAGRARGQHSEGQVAPWRVPYACASGHCVCVYGGAGTYSASAGL